MTDEASLGSVTIDHSRSRTLTQTDNSWYTLLTLNTANHFDVAEARRLGFGELMMNSTLTLAVVIGILSHEFGSDLARCMVLNEVRLIKSLRADDSLSVVSVTSAGPAGDTVISTGRNQDGEGVIVLNWTLPERPAPLASVIADAAANAPKLNPDRVFASLPCAPAFDDFAVGQRVDHGTGRTVTRDEAIWMALLSMREGGAYVDLHHARKAGLPDIVVDEFFVLATVLGLGVKHSTQAAVANLGWRDIQFWHPVHPGDTIYSESEVLETRLSSSRPGQGIVSLRTTGRNQRDDVIVTYDRSFLTYQRAARPVGMRAS